jgi:hypothetical protein
MPLGQSNAMQSPCRRRLPAARRCGCLLARARPSNRRSVLVIRYLTIMTVAQALNPKPKQRRPTGNAAMLPSASGIESCKASAPLPESKKGKNILRCESRPDGIFRKDSLSISMSGAISLGSVGAHRRKYLAVLTFVLAPCQRVIPGFLNSAARDD